MFPNPEELRLGDLAEIAVSSLIVGPSLINSERRYSSLSTLAGQNSIARENPLKLVRN